jgi:outer membrane cobalamin receptor|nr:MAG TPA: hypothetical protein [Caudoviricetes sp.]
MATTKDAKYKVHNGTDFDTIHFETKASQVIANDGSNLETHLAQSASKHITESGSNSNGSYIKFDDGTMICSAKRGPTTTDSTIRNLYSSPVVSWVYPHAFTDVISVQVSAYYTNKSTQFATVSNISNDRATAVLISDSVDASGYINFIVIGRWKQ